MAINKNIIDRINHIKEQTVPLFDKLNMANKALEPIESVRKQIEKIQYSTLLNKYEKQKSILWHFKNEILEHSDPTDPIVIDFLRDTLSKLKGNKTTANKFLKSCIYIALKREQERSIDNLVLHRFISSGEVESVYWLLHSNISPRESKIIISYLCVYICFIEGFANYVNEKININDDICIIRTNSHYQKLAVDAQKIIIRELNNKQTNYRIAKILKDELSSKYKRVPSNNTFQNWIELIKKHLKQRSDK
ncbi:hypothetical protein PMJ71_001661 [Escherichia coli]|nr:hypothetical protein [Escherichia coli]